MELKGGFSSSTSPVEAQSFSRPLIMEKEWEADLSIGKLFLRS